ncbi:MAG: Rpn family recombination-promoting nuclease/putative transposase [Myxococcota bacterium]
MSGPHDLLFRLTFSRPSLAADQVRAVLPETLTRHLDLGKMRVLPSTFVQVELREFISDILYEVPMVDGRQAQIWMLMEHQSRADP